MIRKGALEIVTVLVFLTVVVGVAMTYFAVPNKYHASVDADSYGATYTVSTNSAIEYTVLAYDNAKPVEKLHIYYDEDYAVYGITRTRYVETIDGTIAELRLRGLTNIEIVNADRLAEVVSEYKPGDAVLITVGVLPDTVYSAADGVITNSMIFDWVEEGGTLYWNGPAIGSKFAERDLIKDAPPTYQIDIFGAECINPSIYIQKATERTHDAAGRDLGTVLMLNDNNVMSCLNIDALRTAGSTVMSLGFELDGYSSAALLKKGDGMICVLNTLYDESMASISQIIASGITHDSTLIFKENGSLVRNTVTGDIGPWHSEPEGTIGVQIRMGEPNTVYARTFFI